MTRDHSDKILAGLKKYYGNVSPDLKYNSLYELTIAVVLSAQTTDVQVNAVTDTLFKAYPGFNELSQAPLNNVEKIIHSTGFYRNKAKNIIHLSQKIMDEYNGILPGTREELTSLPGVGRKSANVILSVGYGKPALAVDTHIKRIARRLGYTASENPDTVELDLTNFIPEKNWTYAHLVLIRHGREICKARNPLCSKCPIADLCYSHDKTS